MMGKLKHPVGINTISRRNFLKLSTTGIVAALGLGIPSHDRLLNIIHHIYGLWINSTDLIDVVFPKEVVDPTLQGRVLDTSVNIYELPTYNSSLVNTYYRDWLLPVTDITVGTLEDSFNMVWYKIGTEGYAHSGSIQPVRTKLNPVTTDIPPDGAIAEVTVPFTDARWNPGENELVAYRFYYSSTYWITDLVRDKNGKPWYSVLDDKWEYLYYVPAEHLRVIPYNEIQPISPEVNPRNKHIEVHLPEQVMIAYEHNKPVFMARIASGAVFSNGDFSTPPGRYMTFHKRPSRHMARGNLAANGYDLPGVPWNSYITEEGIAFHGTYWHNNFGKPRSHGCINLTPQAAKWIFLWTLPSVPPNQEGVYKKTGTIVNIVD